MFKSIKTSAKVMVLVLVITTVLALFTGCGGPSPQELAGTYVGSYEYNGNLISVAVVINEEGQYASATVKNGQVSSSETGDYEVKGNKFDEGKAQGGIGIVPFVYQNAFNYYYAIWEAQQKQEHILGAESLEQYIPKTIEVRIPVPQRQERKRNLLTVSRLRLSEPFFFRYKF